MPPIYRSSGDANIGRVRSPLKSPLKRWPTNTKLRNVTPAGLQSRRGSGCRSTPPKSRMSRSLPMRRCIARANTSTPWPSPLRGNESHPYQLWRETHALGRPGPFPPKLEMIPLHTVIKAAATASVATLLSAGALGGTASAMEARDATETFGRLTALNNSGAEDSAEATVNGRRVVVDIDARKLVKGVPHAQHIHFGAQARHECPQAFDDKNATTS
jgi:hypothetical protein